MPILKLAKDLKQLYLPSTEKEENADDKFWVTMDVSPAKTGDIAIMDSGMTQGQFNIEILVARIEEWNAQDEADGKTLPINYQTVSGLLPEDSKFLLQQIKADEQELTDDQKKTLQPTSSPEPMDSPAK